MANGHGGLRTPSNPAPVSGPGAHSQRTDGTPAQQHAQALRAPTDMGYGEHKAMIDSERLAPLTQSTMPAPPAPSAAGAAAPGDAGGSIPQYQGGPFHAPTQQPGTPVTNGVAIGPGAGPEALPSTQMQQVKASGAMSQMLSKLSATDATGSLAPLLQAAMNRGI